MRDTIFAQATAPGRAAVALVRISGPEAGRVLDRLTAPRPEARRATLRKLHDPLHGELLDHALVLWAPGPASFTGEDVVELQLHGGRAVVEGVVLALTGEGLRLAEPGEFTRRAFEAGRMELSQAEAIADLVDAETSAQRQQALAQLGGALARRYEGWRARLIEALALLEAEIDFPDEDLPGGLVELALRPLGELRTELLLALQDPRGERVREGYRVALVGAPNAGKSSLFNSLLRRDAAIVTATAGTTRDVIEATLNLAGYAVVLADMAGVREATDAIEVEGVRRARNWAEEADLRLWIVDRSGGEGAWSEAAAHARGGDLLILNKADLAVGRDQGEALAWAADRGLDILEVEALAGGADEVRGAIEWRAVSAMSGADAPAVTRARHRRLLEQALSHIDRGLADASLGAELAAESVRLAARELERISGRIDPEAVLEQVFGSFCIGK